MPRSFFVVTALCLTATAWADPRAALFDVEDFSALPPEVKILSEKTEEGVVLSELTFQGAPFNGQPTRIYAFYARPATGDRFPGVVLIHGANLGVLKKDGAVNYARNGFACLSLDWAGPAAERKKPRQPPYSEVSSPGPMAQKLGENKFAIHGVETDLLTNAVRFILRGLEFLRNQPEVDSENLFLSGTSAGAHLTLMAVGLDPKIRGVSVKYGNAFIRDMPGYFGGYFGPLSLTPKDQQDEWLAALDPKHGFPAIRANVLMLSGTDDIFFWMPIVLESYRQLPGPKHLIMIPNDNHSTVNVETLPMKYFQSILGVSAAFPVAETPSANVEGNELLLSTTVDSKDPEPNVSFVVKRMPLSGFRWKEDPPWEVIPAVLEGTLWQTRLPALTPGEQIVAYANVENADGSIGSSDTLEVPDYPRWRGQKPQN